jgi:hypothetical protein
MEKQTSFAVPEEGGQRMLLQSATQNCDETRMACALALGMSGKDVTVKTRRMGGAYGGKITGSIRAACGVAVAAQKYVPQRIDSSHYRIDSLFTLSLLCAHIYHLPSTLSLTTLPPIQLPPSSPTPSHHPQHTHPPPHSMFVHTFTLIFAQVRSACEDADGYLPRHV